MQQNYYTVLGISYSASKQDIKKAFKKLAILYHPDKHQGNRYFEEKFKIVNEAYQVLSDERRKARYDLRLKQVLQQQQAQQHFNARYGHTREPASFAERHYMQRPQYRPRPKPQPEPGRLKEILLTLAVFVAIILGSLLTSHIMDHVTGKGHYHDAMAEMDQGNYGKAYVLFTEALHFKPEYAEAYYQRGVIEMDQYNNCLAAIANFDAALEFADKELAQTYYRRGACHSKLGSHQQAEADLSKAIALNKTYGDAYFARGEIELFYLINYSSAISDFSSVLRFSKDHTSKNKALYYRGFSYYQNGQYEQAITDYKTALKTDPKNGRLHFLIGKAEYEQGHTPGACRYFKKAFDLGYTAALGDLQQYCTDTTAVVPLPL